MAEKPKKKFSKRWQLRHVYFKRSGLYGFVIKNLIKMFLILGAFVGLVLLLNHLLIVAGIDLKSEINTIIERLNTGLVLIIFFVSESILGWIPPDLFIVWAKSRPTIYPYLNVGIIATISYMGGVVAYYIGKQIRRFPKVNSYVERRYAENFVLIQKWGGIVVVMAALFPLPYATISTIAGIVKYPFRSFLLFGLTRYLRFFLYAIPIFKGLEKLM